MQLIDLFPGHLYNEAVLTRSMVNLDKGKGFLTFEYRMQDPLHESGQKEMLGIVYLEGIQACRPYNAFARKFDGEFDLSSLAYEVVNSDWVKQYAPSPTQVHHYLLAGVNDFYLAVIAEAIEIREEKGFRAF